MVFSALDCRIRGVDQCCKQPTALCSPFSADDEDAEQLAKAVETSGDVGERLEGQELERLH